jgi:hypothetical protein
VAGFGCDRLGGGTDEICATSSAKAISTTAEDVRVDKAVPFNESVPWRRV